MVVVSNPSDEHGDFIVRLIRSRGHRAVRLSAESMSGREFTWRPETGLATDAVELGQEPLAGIWRRSGVVDTEDLDARYQTFARSEWFDACEGAILELPIRWLTPLESIRSAELKLVQVAAARRAGLPVPETLVTNDPAEAINFASMFPCVVKPVRYGLVEEEPPRVAWTREVSVEDLRSLSGPPVILQRLLRARLHLRVVTVDTRCFVAELDAPELDWRSNLANHSRFRRAGPMITSMVSGPAARLAMNLGLGFSSQDWLVDRDDDLHFLEANPNGQWLFITECATEIGAAIVDALEERLNAGDAEENPGLSD